MDGIFGNLLGGYVAGVDKQTELAQQLARDVFQQSQANWQRFDTDRKFAYAQEQDAAEQAYRQSALLQQGRIADQNYELDKAKQDADAQRYAAQLAETTRYHDLLAENAKSKLGEARSKATMDRAFRYATELMKQGVPEADAWAQAVSKAALEELETPSEQGTTAPMGATASPTGFDLMGMLSGYASAAPTMPAGVPQGLTGNYDPTKPLPGIENNMDYKRVMADAAKTRQGISLQKNLRDIEKLGVDVAHKKALTDKLKKLTPLEGALLVQRELDLKSRINYRTQQLQRQKQNDQFLNDYRRAKTDTTRKPDALKEWGLKERVQLETRKSKAQSEWRQNEKMLTDLKQQQRNATNDGKTRPTDPLLAATYDDLQAQIEETEAMKEASKADYYQYQQMAKEVGFFKPNTPEGLAERGRANPRDLPVQPRNMGTNKPRITPTSEVKKRQPGGSLSKPLKTTEKVFNVNGKSVKVRRIN